MKKLLTLNEFRINLPQYIKKIQNGSSFTIYKRSKPVFVVSPAADTEWEEVIDFTKLQKGGIEINDLLSRL